MTERDHPLTEIYNSVNEPLIKIKTNFQPSSIQNKIEKQNANISNIKLLKKPNIPHPWLFPSLNVDLELSNVIRKKETNVLSQKQISLEYIENNYKHYTKIYTDGSRIDEKTACGVYWENIDTISKIRLDDNLNITSAETFAIWAALKLTEIRNTPHNNNILILSDSKATLQNLKKEIDQTERPDIIHRIHLQNSNLLKHNINVTYLWIPAHCGLSGNENADEAAKIGANYWEVEHKIGLSKNEFHSIYKKEVSMKKWQNNWSLSSCTTHSYFPTIYIKNRILRCIKNNGKLARILLNRPYFWPYPNFNEKCIKCDKIKTIKHVLLECIEHKKERDILINILGFKPCTLMELLNIKTLDSHIQSINKFINSLNEEI